MRTYTFSLVVATVWRQIVWLSGDGGGGGDAVEGLGRSVDWLGSGPSGGDRQARWWTHIGEWIWASLQLGCASGLLSGSADWPNTSPLAKRHQGDPSVLHDMHGAQECWEMESLLLCLDGKPGSARVMITICAFRIKVRMHFNSNSTPLIWWGKQVAELQFEFNCEKSKIQTN